MKYTAIIKWHVHAESKEEAEQFVRLILGQQPKVEIRQSRVPHMRAKRGSGKSVYIKVAQ